MFDIGLAELLVIVAVAVMVVGPKELPAALRQAGRWLGKFRRMSSHVRSGIDTMIREAEMEDMEKDWKAQNERIMRDHPTAAGEIPEFEPMRGGAGAEAGAGASAEEPQMRPLIAHQVSPPDSDSNAGPRPSELPQLPFDESTDRNTDRANDESAD